MLTTTTAYQAAALGPGFDEVAAYVELWTAGTKKATSDLVSWTVTQDRTASSRWSLSAVLPDLTALLPEAGVVGQDRAFGEGTFGSGTFGDYRRSVLRGLLVPLVTQARVYLRVKTPGASAWTVVPMGRYTVQEPSFAGTDTDRSVSISGLDASADIASAAWDGAYVVTEGTNVRDALIGMLTNRLPGVAVSAPSTTAVTPQLVYTPGYQEGSGSPWQDAQDVAALAGWDLWVDRAGTVVAGVPGEPASGPGLWPLDWDRTVASAKQAPSARDLVNTVVVYGESSGDVPVVAVVQDTTSPYGTAALGRVVAKEVRSSSIATVEEATNVGITMLRLWGALTDTVTGSAFPLWHLDAGDLVTVTLPDLGLHGQVYRVERLSHSDRIGSDFTVARRIG